MEHSLQDILKYKKELENCVGSYSLIVCPPFCYLPIMHSKYYKIGAQDVSCYGNGSYTGKVSAQALKSLDVYGVLIGHSEIEDSFESKLKKLRRVVSEGMQAYVLISDTKEEHDQNLYLQRLEEQLDYLVQDLKGDEFIVAYEPIYAIGTGDIPKNEDIKKIAKMIKEKYQVRVLYGGSVNQDNAALLSQIEELDGFLLGGISLKLDKLQELIKKLS